MFDRYGFILVIPKHTGMASLKKKKKVLTSHFFFKYDQVIGGM